MAEQDATRRKLQLESGAADGKIKKLEEDVLIMEDQKNKLQKVCIKFDQFYLDHNRPHLENKHQV